MTTNDDPKTQSAPDDRLDGRRVDVVPADVNHVVGPPEDAPLQPQPGDAGRPIRRPLAHPHQVAVGLRREMGLGVAQPVENGQPPVARQGAENGKRGSLVRHIAN